MEPFVKKYEKRRLTAIWLSPVILFAGTFLSLAVFTGAAVLIAPLLLSAKSGGTMWLSAAAQYLIGMPLCAVFLSIIPADPMERFRLQASGFLQYFLNCCTFMMVGSLIGSAVSNIPGLPQTPDMEEILSGTSPLYQVLCIVVLAPLWEEFIFRKIKMM